MPFSPPIILDMRLYSSTSSITSGSGRPAPRAMRSRRLGTLKILTSMLSSSAAVMLSMRHMKRLMRAALAASWPLGIMSAMPGIMLITDEIDPMEPMCWNCSYMMRMLNCPWVSLSISSGCAEAGMTSLILSMKPCQSPRPSRRDTKERGSNGSNSSVC